MGWFRAHDYHVCTRPWPLSNLKYVGDAIVALSLLASPFYQRKCCCLPVLQTRSAMRVPGNMSWTLNLRSLIRCNAARFSHFIHLVCAITHMHCRLGTEYLTDCVPFLLLRASQETSIPFITRRWWKPASCSLVHSTPQSLPWHLMLAVDHMHILL